MHLLIFGAGVLGSLYAAGAAGRGVPGGGPCPWPPRRATSGRRFGCPEVGTELSARSRQRDLVLGSGNVLRPCTGARPQCVLIQ